MLVEIEDFGHNLIDIGQNLKDTREISNMVHILDVSHNLEDFFPNFINFGANIIDFGQTRNILL